MTGRTVSHYHIKEKLGGGAMGVVYRAEDLRLDRSVALKFLPPEFTRDETVKQRFIQEARAASALDHSHICTIHDIGETEEGKLFIVMPFYEGETLKQKVARGPRPVEEAARYARQIAEGLEAAHAAGIIHRDIKPANVMITKKGQVKIVDFGLAKGAGADLTKIGQTLGTAAYMSPEQARGKDVGPATDLWSLGIVLYEMLTGQRPFESSYEQAVVYKIFNEEPRPLKELRPEVPERLTELAEDLLRKDPAGRPQGAGEVADRLQTAVSNSGQPGSTKSSSDQSMRWVGGVSALVVLLMIAGLLIYSDPFASESSPAGAGGPDGWAPRLGSQSIAVLPFTYLAATDSSDYFSQGMTDELLIRLSQVKDLSVISRTSVMQYVNTDKAIPEIARELGVAYVLEGNVQQAEGQVRLQARLIDARTGRHIWAEGITRPFRDVLQLQVDLAQEIAGQLEVTLLPETQRRMAGAAEVDSAAYSLYLQARALRFQETAESLTEAVRLLRRSVTLDSTFAPAWAALSTAAWFGPASGGSLSGGIDGDSLARAAARRALRIDSTSAEAHVAMGTVRQVLDHNYPAAGPHLQQAVKLNPGLANAHREYGLYFYRMGQFEAAERYLGKAARLDPVSPLVMRDLGWNHLQLGNYEEAKRYLRKALTFQSDLWNTRTNLGLAYLKQDSVEAGLHEMRRAVREKANPWTLAHLGWAYAKAGLEDSTRAVLERIDRDFERGFAFHWSLAALYAALGNTNRALDLLKRPVLKTTSSWVKVHPFFDSLRDEPRFQRLLREMGLDEASVRQTMEKLGE